MSTLILFASSHGCAEKSAYKLKEKLKDNSQVVSFKEKHLPTISDFNNIIIGGSIHAGKIQKRVASFCENNKEILLQKKLGLFLCCMEEGEKAQKQFDDAFPLELIKHSSANGIFGGEFDFDKMNFMEKMIIKRVAKITESISRFREEAVDEFVEKFIDS